MPATQAEASLAPQEQAAAQAPVTPRQPPAGRTGSSRKRDATKARRPARRWRLVGLLLAVAVVVAAVVTLTVTHRLPSVAGGSTSPGGQRIAAEAVVRSQTVAWVASQVGRDVVVACDAVMCGELAQHGFPAGNLNVLQPTAPDPYGSQLVIASADIRDQFGAKLASTYAPVVLASFGTGINRIEVRLIAPSGAAALRAALSQDQAASQHAGAQLLTSARITVSVGARKQLEAGQVDLRLLTAIAFLSVREPVAIVGFGTLAPGAGPDLPLRYAYLAENDAAAHLRGTSYLLAVLAVIHGLPPLYVPNSVATIRLPDGQAVLRVEFPAPSPLGLLQS